MRLLRGFWKLLVGVKDGLVLLFMLLFFGALYALLSAAPNPRTASGGGALQVTLDGSLVEQPTETDPLSALSSSNTPREYRLRDVVRAIRGAATDDLIKAVVLDLDRFTGGGQATIAAAADAVDAVRRANKPVLAFATGYTDGGYLLASHASEVWLDTLGAVLLQGRGGSQLYYKGLLDKIGVETKVYRVGKYKSFVEPYTRTEQSPEARAANQALADALWASWNVDVKRARPNARVAPYVAAPGDAVARAGGDTAQAAVNAGLVDHLGDRIAFGRRVAQLAGEADKKRPGQYRAVPLASWIAGHAEPSGGAAIGVVTIAGDIVDGDGGPGSAAGDTIAKLILDELPRNRIKALVVRVDSPGGSVSASERIRNAIVEAKRRGLPVVVSMGSVAASGGYWVSTPADRIFAEPSTITGSIGVFGILPTFKGTLAKLGLSSDGIKTTPLSGEPNLYAGTSPEFDRLMQTGIESIYRRFTGLVAQSRHLPIARVDEIAQGRVWSGNAARQIGLIDAYGGIDAAIAEAARRAKLDPAQVHAQYIEAQPSWWSKLAAGMTRGSPYTPTDAFSRIAHGPEQDMLRALADFRVMARGPAMQVRCLECPVTGIPRGRDIGLTQLLLDRLGLR